MTFLRSGSLSRRLINQLAFSKLSSIPIEYRQWLKLAGGDAIAWRNTLQAGFTKTASLVFEYLNLFPLSLLLSFKSSSAQQQLLSLSSESKSSNSGWAHSCWYLHLLRPLLCLVRGAARAAPCGRDATWWHAVVMPNVSITSSYHELLSEALTTGFTMHIQTVYSSPTDRESHHMRLSVYKLQLHQVSSVIVPACHVTSMYRIVIVNH